MAALAGRSVNRVTGCLLALLVAATACADDRPAGNAASAAPRTADEPARVRRFVLRYAAEIEKLPAGARTRVWVPLPTNDEFQTIEPLARDLPAAAANIEETMAGDNHVLYFDAIDPDDGALRLALNYRVERREVRGDDRRAAQLGPTKLAPQARAKHLAAESRVPIDGKPLELLAARDLPQDPYALARTIYDRVDEHVRYDKSQPGYGRGDVRWVCDSRFGNCTDFHSLFISLARSQGLPARFEIGFPIPPDRGRGRFAGYHCWAYFHVDGAGWTPVDISEADKHPELRDYYFGNLDENRVTFTRGRDLELAPRQAGPPLNFFIYPYIEVDGRPWPVEKMKLTFSYEDE